VSECVAVCVRRFRCLCLSGTFACLPLYVSRYNKFTGESRWHAPPKRAYEEHEDTSHFKHARKHRSKSGMRQLTREDNSLLGAFERLPSDEESDASVEGEN